MVATIWRSVLIRLNSTELKMYEMYAYVLTEPLTHLHSLLNIFSYIKVNTLVMTNLMLYIPLCGRVAQSV